MNGPHAGQTYETFMSELSSKREPRNYLEIGVNAGNLLARITAVNAVGVDPSFVVSHNIANNKKTLTLHQCTSDRYFKDAAPAEPFDLIFLDGMHTFEFTLRDFYNAEHVSSTKTLIILHDCLPLSAEMSDRVEAQAISRGVGSPYAGWWTGDVWKIIPILMEYRPDLQLIFLDCPPTGLVCVTNLDPNSKVLEHKYLEIIKKYAALPNTEESISKLYETIEMTPSSLITNNLDHSCYFMT